MNRSIGDEMQDWLLRPLPIEEAESRHVFDGVPFGGLQNAKWLEVRSRLSSDPNTQLWSFCSPPETWTTFPLRGMEGYAVVKNGKIIDFVLVAVS